MAIQRILVAVDGTPASQKAVEVAIDLAEPAGLELTFVLVSEEYMERLIIEHPFTPDTDQRLAAEVPVLGDVAKVASDRGVDFRLHLVGAVNTSANVVEALVAAAKTREADLIVVGSRGMSGLARRFVGSVSEGIVKESEVPTVLVHPDED